MSNEPTNYDKGSSHFVKRARTQLRLFDQGQTESLFYAALELRFGIEARLHEYIDCYARRERADERHRREYSATKLFNELERIDPKSTESITLEIQFAKNTPSLQFTYTPVARKLAKIHGRLGQVLHFTVFERYSISHQQTGTHGDGSRRSLNDVRDWLLEVTDELDRVTSGGMLTHPGVSDVMLRLFEVEVTSNPSSEKTMKLTPRRIQIDAIAERNRSSETRA